VHIKYFRIVSGRVEKGVPAAS